MSKINRKWMHRIIESDNISNEEEKQFLVNAEKMINKLPKYLRNFFNQNCDWGDYGYWTYFWNQTHLYNTVKDMFNNWEE